MKTTPKAHRAMATLDLNFIDLGMAMKVLRKEQVRHPFRKFYRG